MVREDPNRIPVGSHRRIPQTHPGGCHKYIAHLSIAAERYVLFEVRKPTRLPPLPADTTSPHPLPLI